MKLTPQVDALRHYQFREYLDKRRWMSIWHQLDTVLSLSPRRVLEVGPGSGVFSELLRRQNVHVETVDIDERLNPDHISSADELPFDDRSYDVVCAFQVLEHMPFDVSLKALNELGRVSSGHAVISLPFSHPAIRLVLSLPRLGTLDTLLRIPRPKPHSFDGEHYWEIGKRGYDLDNIVGHFSRLDTLALEGHWGISENPYHYFFRFARRIAAGVDAEQYAAST